MRSDLEQPLRGVKIAITVDDLFEWMGAKRFEKYSYLDIAKTFTKSFSNHGLREVYAFSNTAAAADERDIKAVFDHWLVQGQHVGNHTHHHASIDWMAPTDYIGDIERSDGLISNWITQAPRRFFRYCFDMWGSDEERRREVNLYLAREGYEIAPISIWFYDAQFAQAYIRALTVRDESAQAWLRDRFVETAIEQLRLQAAAARTIFRRDPAHIWLIHGTAIAADCLPRILDEFARLGVEFISLDEAMRDPMNQHQPIITDLFRNQVQKWARHTGLTIENCPPAILSQLDSLAPVPGMAEHELIGGYFGRIIESMGLDPLRVEFKVA